MWHARPRFRRRKVLSSTVSINDPQLMIRNKAERSSDADEKVEPQSKASDASTTLDHGSCWKSPLDQESRFLQSLLRRGGVSEAGDVFSAWPSNGVCWTRSVGRPRRVLR